MGPPRAAPCLPVGQWPVPGKDGHSVAWGMGGAGAGTSWGARVLAGRSPAVGDPTFPWPWAGLAELRECRPRGAGGPG